MLFKQMTNAQTIKSPAAKNFFEIETKIRATEFCLLALNQLLLQKQRQIICERKHVKYNQIRLQKKIEKTKAEFEAKMDQIDVRYDKFVADIEAIQARVMVVKNPETSEALDEVGSKLSIFFESDKFMEHGEELKDHWIKFKDVFMNFLGRYKELKPSQNISSLNVEAETNTIKEFSARFNEEKRRVRQVQSEFRNG